MMQLSKKDAVVPVIALETLRYPITESEAVDVVFAGRGPELSVYNLQNEHHHSQMIFEHSCIGGIRAYLQSHDFLADATARTIQLLVWSERSLAVMDYKYQEGEHCCSWILSIDNSLDDLVLDSALVPLAAEIHPNGEFYLIISYAHHFIDILQTTSQDANTSTTAAQLMHRFQCPELCVLFSSTMHINSMNDILISSGTAFGKIILWHIGIQVADTVVSEIKPGIDRSFTTFCETVSSLHGHEGVIFRTKWSPNRRLLASVSDDRTFRIWRQLTNDSRSLIDEIAPKIAQISIAKHDYEQVFIGWGHSNRPWDVIFYSFAGSEYIATCSEDSTVKMWDIPDLRLDVQSGNSPSQADSLLQGQCVATMRGHENSVWRIIQCPDSDVIISGGNDGSIKLWNVESHLILSADAPESTLVEWDIPDAPTDASHNASDSTKSSSLRLPDAILGENVNNIAAISISQESDVLPNMNKSSRRQNGVCDIFADVHQNLLCVVMIDGGVWLVNPSTPQLTSVLPPQWQFLGSFGKAVASAHVHFADIGGYTIIQIACCHPDCAVSIALSKVENFNQPWQIISWKAHQLRAVKIWLLPENGIDGDRKVCPFVLTASMKGTCKLWRVRQSPSQTLDVDLLLNGSTERGEIAISCLLSSPQILSAPSANAEPNVGSSGAEITYGENFRLLFVGFSRGSIVTFLVLDGSPKLTELVSRVADPIVFLGKAHGSDPVTAISFTTQAVNYPNNSLPAGLLTLGHDGYLNSYSLCLPADFQQSLTNDYIPTLLGDNGESEYKRASSLGENVGRLAYPLNPLILVTKQSTLPIRSPDYINIFQASDQTPDQMSVYIGGFQGELFIVWDMHRKYQIAAVNGGAWKRPHCCALTFTEHRYAPKFLFACPIPKGRDTVLGTYSTLVQKDHLSNRRTLNWPLHLSANSHGKVSYCASILHLANRSVVISGGELGVVKVFNLSLQSMVVSSLVQELDMPSGVAVKAMTTISRCQSAVGSYRRGVLVCTGGRLMYAIWHYNSGDDDDMVRKLPLQKVFSQRTHGTTWPRATQDHRMLSVSGLHLYQSGSTDYYYYIVFTDSRGKVTICTLDDDDSSLENRNGALKIIEEFSASEYPVLTSKVIQIESDSNNSSIGGPQRFQFRYLLGVFGDSDGSVLIYLLAGSTMINGEILACSRLLAVLPTHDMGTNALDVLVFGSTVAMSDRASSQGDLRSSVFVAVDETLTVGPKEPELEEPLLNKEFVVFSGGDDQSVAVSYGRISYDRQNKTVLLAMHASVNRLLGAAGSALKGVKLAPLPVRANTSSKSHGIDDKKCIGMTVGYDQRLSVWSIFGPSVIPYGSSPLEVSPEATTSEEVLDTSPFRRVAVDRTSNSTVVWECGSTVNVGDVCSLAVSNRQHEGSTEIVGDNRLSSTVDIVVIGEGLQLFKLELQ